MSAHLELPAKRRQYVCGAFFRALAPLRTDRLMTRVIRRLFDHYFESALSVRFLPSSVIIEMAPECMC
jgi:hypothetical protein